MRSCAKQEICKADFWRRVNALADNYPYMWDEEFGRSGQYDIMPGWIGLLEEGLAAIDARLTEQQKRGFVITQIKEKLGTLRIYTNAQKDWVFAIKANAEAASQTLCLFCGQPAVLTNLNGWRATLCAFHTRCLQQAGLFASLKSPVCLQPCGCTAPTMVSPTILIA